MLWSSRSSACPGVVWSPHLFMGRSLKSGEHWGLRKGLEDEAEGVKGAQVEELNPALVNHRAACSILPLPSRSFQPSRHRSSLEFWLNQKPNIWLMFGHLAETLTDKQGSNLSLSGCFPSPELSPCAVVCDVLEPCIHHLLPGNLACLEGRGWKPGWLFREAVR